MIVGGSGGVGLIPCDLGCINGVDLSFHFFSFLFKSFVLILWIFFFKLYWVVIEAGGLLLVVAGCTCGCGL